MAKRRIFRGIAMSRRKTLCPGSCSFQRSREKLSYHRRGPRPPLRIALEPCRRRSTHLPISLQQRPSSVPALGPCRRHSSFVPLRHRSKRLCRTLPFSELWILCRLQKTSAPIDWISSHADGSSQARSPEPRGGRPVPQPDLLAGQMSDYGWQEFSYWLDHRDRGCCRVPTYGYARDGQTGA